MKETINNEVIDTYKEHSQHLVYRSDCSECYNKAPQVTIGQDGDIVLVGDGLEVDTGVEELERCKACDMPCEHLYCDKCDKEIHDYEMGRQDE